MLENCKDLYGFLQIDEENRCVNNGKRDAFAVGRNSFSSMC